MPTDESAWSPRLRVYFKAVTQSHARRKDTSLGTLMVTNLSGFPSALTVIAVPDGDIRKHREDFIVNENLKRLGCSGRVGLNLSPPTGATQAKFQLSYHTSDRVPLQMAVVELVKLCQVALMLFAKLAPEYADGLLCDVTERAINDWWTELGTDFYNTEPNDGILGPSTVAALLGMLVGARNRLNAYGAPVAKDAFDISSLKRGIAYFQKSQKLERTRRLDRQTLDKLHRVTAKAANSEGWNVPKAVKSTVAELSGKGGEMVMGMVGAREKAGIAEVETTDLERFIELVQGDRAKWLWFGKPLKAIGNDTYNSLGNNHRMVFGNDEQGGYLWSSTKRDSVADEAHSRLRPTVSRESRLDGTSSFTLDSGDRDSQVKKNVIKSVAGKMSDARSGFERIKDAVGRSGLRGHHSRHSKETNAFQEKAGRSEPDKDTSNNSTLAQTRSLSPSTPASLKRTSENTSESTSIKHPPSSTGQTQAAGRNRDSPAGAGDQPEVLAANSGNRSGDGDRQLVETENNTGKVYDRRGSVPQVDTAEPSVAGSIYRDSDYEELLPEREAVGNQVGILLRRTQSVSNACSRNRDDSWWPRHLSFSTIDEAVLTWEEIGCYETDADEVPVTMSGLTRKERALAEGAKAMREKISDVQEHIGAPAVQKIEDLELLDMQGSQLQAELSAIYTEKLRAYESLQSQTNEMLVRERIFLRDATTDVEQSAAKLEYELNALESKVEEVEDALVAFEQMVSELETRTESLRAEHVSRDSISSWLFGLLSGARIGISHMLRR